ncbi:MAG: hypothetical protein U9Q15_04895, partial [Patescibacteria group bacterium]|nr:hypothetical protein [Patescibacteria group bacterium]
MSLFHDISQRKRPKDIDLSIKKDSANRRSPLIIQDFVVSDDSADIDVEKSRYTNSFFDKAKRMIVCFGKVTYAFLDGFLQALSHWGRSTVSMYLVKKENNQKDFWGTSQQAVWSQKRQSSRKALYKAKDLFVPFFFLVFLSFSYQAVSV